MGKYEQLIKEELILTEEGEMPLAPATEPPMEGGGMDMAGGMPGGGGAPPDPTEAMGNDTKRDADPMAYTRQTLKTLVDADEGVSPEMFADFIDMFGVGLTKIRDKEGFKKFYNEFYNQLKQVVSMNDKLKSMYEQLHSNMQDVMTTQSTEPNTAGGDPGAEGPGV